MVTSESSHALSADFLLVIALKEEFKYFQTALDVALEPQVIDGRQCYRFSLPAAQDQFAQGVAAFIGDMGAEEAALITSQLLSKTGAGLVANIGISGIVSDELRIGDVVVASEADNYLFRSKIVSKQGSSGSPSFDNIRFAGKSLPTTVFLYELVDNLEIVDHRAWQNWINDSRTALTSLINQADRDFLEKEDLIDRAVKIAVGPVATGPWVGAAAAFKDLLKSERNRNFLAMDMESAGVLQAARRVSGVQTIIIRGISDPADERKQKLDDIRGGSLRQWAMGNAIRLFALLLRKVDVAAYSQQLETIPSAESGADRRSILEDSLHQNIIREYLTSPYNIGVETFDSYSDLFRCLCSYSPPSTKAGLFESIADAVLLSPNLAPVKVEGPPGTGKSSFLSILYWYLLHRHSAARSDPLPLLINLHRYNDPPSESGRDAVTENEVLSLVQNHLRPLKELLNESDNSLIVIIDGDDESARFREQVLTYLFQILSVCKHWRIIGSRNSASSITPTNDTGESDVSAVFSPLPIASGALHDFVEKFVSVASPTRDSALVDELEEQIKQLKLKTIDLFTMSLLFKQQRSSALPPRQNLAAMFEGFCERYLGQRGIPGSKSTLLDRAATLAFDLQIRRVRNPKLRPEDMALWDLVHKHSRIADYLIARYVINGLVKNPSGNAKAANTLKYLYPYRINTLCKEILNKDQNTQIQVVKAAGKILQREGVHSTAMAQAVYLAGRVEDWQARDIAKQTLQRFRENLKRKETAGSVTKEILLLTRTLSISLAELGDETAEQAYIEGLLADPKLDMFNRGFHLEYYGDQEYSPADPLRSDDNLGPAPRTFDQLLKEISNKDNPIFEIALYTLCSLAQHRHAIGKLSLIDRERLGHAIDTVLDNRRIKSTSLKSYLTMVRKHLKFDAFFVARIFEDFYKIKRIPRSGWVRRGIDKPESVADHSYGAYLIALFLLPEAWQDPDYDKQQILKMILIHDLAEAVTGDVLPEDSNDESKQREREVYDEIGVLGTYDGLGRLRDVAELWKEFEARTTLNAKVAKDVDKLENLLQLWAYNADGLRIEDFEKWNRELIDAINTGPGIHVLEKLLEAHKDKTGVTYIKQPTP